MDAKDVLDKYYKELVTILPMRDSLFLASLTAKGLFPGDRKNKIRAESTEKDAAVHLLDDIAKELVIDTRSLMQLLLAMKEFSVPLEKLAEEILKSLPDSIRNGEYASLSG